MFTPRYFPAAGQQRPRGTRGWDRLHQGSPTYRESLHHEVRGERPEEEAEVEDRAQPVVFRSLEVEILADPEYRCDFVRDVCRCADIGRGVGGGLALSLSPA